MTRNKLLRALGAAVSAVLPNVYTTAEITAAVDRVRDRDDCRSRASDYACGLEDGAVTVVYEVGIATIQYPESKSNPYPEKGWATDQSG